MPVDYLRIDGSLEQHLVDIINQLGDVMERKTIEEFVETRDILGSLRTLGVE
jgi:EAL domain-containing protein (putative c-di-GMP-specific phosphodiesterase class I)